MFASPSKRVNEMIPNLLNFFTRNLLAEFFVVCEPHLLVRVQYLGRGIGLIVLTKGLD